MSDAPSHRSHVQREQVFQSVVDRFIDRVVLPPMWTTGINHENELTDNARARARGRGVKPGVFDVYVCQAGGRSTWLELKWGNNKPSDAQKAVHQQLTRCDIPAFYCWSIDHVVTALENAGFALHPNTANLAIEYHIRAEAAVMAAELRAVRPRSAGKPRPERPTAAAIRRSHRINVVRGLTK